MGLLSEISSYREKSTGMVGLVPNPPDHSCDNGLLFSSTLIALLSGEEMGIEILKWYDRLVNSCQVKEGLFSRYPGDSSLESYDDLIGICYASYVLNLPYAKAIYKRGTQEFWIFNNTGGPFEFRMWLGRFIHFAPFARFCSGQKLGYIDQICLSLAFIWNMRESKNETSGRCLLYLIALAIKGKGYDFLDSAILIWQNFMDRAFPGGMKSVYRIYFGPDHPFTKYAPETF